MIFFGLWHIRHYDSLGCYKIFGLCYVELVRFWSYESVWVTRVGGHAFTGLRCGEAKISD